MQKYFFGLSTVIFFLMLSACGDGDITGFEQESTASTGTNNSTADFFQLAIVPNQTVSAGTFEVQVIAELLNPNAGTAQSPNVIDGSGASHVMVPKILKWPGTAEDSVTIWSATIPLVSNRVNNIKVVSGTMQLALPIRHKSALSILTAINATELVNHIKAAITDPSIDVIQVAYNEPDLGSVIHNAGNNITNARTTWLTIKPATGNTISWVRNSGVSLLARPFVDFLHLSNVVFGSDTSDGAAGTFYVEANHRAWLSATEFRGKYKYTWGKSTPLTANVVPDVRTSLVEGQKVYLTDCLWDGTATEAATSAVQLGRDLRFNSHRGDLNQFGKVVLNMYGQDIETVRNSANSDDLHNDGFQIWGNTGTSNLIFKGLKIVSPNIPANIQPFLLDRSFVPDYSNILMDSVFIVGAAPATVLQAQAAGKISNSRISNFSFPNQNVTFRKDFTETNGAFNPSNVYISNIEVKKVLYLAPAFNKSITYDYRNIKNRNNISAELSANSGLSGVSFTNIKVSPTP